MNYHGIIIGLTTFLIIGLFHPIVVKSEYHFGVRIWPVFLLAGLLFCAGALFVGSPILSGMMGVTGFTCLWSIRELHEQKQRVEKGWFPRNSKRPD